MISESHLKRLKRYCDGDFTEIENYEKAVADTQKWVCHHRKELTEDGEFQYSVEDLIEKGWYYKRAPEELIFMTPAEHMSLHKKGKKLTAEHCENISKAKKGIPRTDATKEKISKSLKGITLKHHDIMVSPTDDKKAYDRALYLKNKEKILVKRRERYYKKKALNAK